MVEAVNTVISGQKTNLDNFYTKLALINEADYFENITDETAFQDYYISLDAAGRVDILVVNNFLTLTLPQLFLTGENMSTLEALAQALIV